MLPSWRPLDAEYPSMAPCTLRYMYFLFLGSAFTLLHLKPSDKNYDPLVSAAAHCGIPLKVLYWRIVSNLPEGFVYFATISTFWFSTWRICSRKQRKKQLGWLATNTDDITNNHIRFLLVRANKFAKWKTGFTSIKTRYLNANYALF